MNPPPPIERGPWTGVLAAYTAGMFMILPIFPRLWRWAASNFPEASMAMAWLPAGILLGLAAFIVARKDGSPLRRLALVAVLLLVGLGAISLCRKPVERFHFAEYVLLSLLAHRALRSRFQGAALFGMLVLYTFTTGVLDEIVQYFLPNRVFDLQDILINWLSAALGIGFTVRRAG